jgi:hypothetical protein
MDVETFPNEENWDGLQACPDGSISLSNGEITLKITLTAEECMKVGEHLLRCRAHHVGADHERVRVRSRRGVKPGTVRGPYTGLSRI